MAGFISEFFGYRADDNSDAALQAAEKRLCPFLNNQCSKILARDRDVSGVCAVKQMSDAAPGIICCPVRLYADDYKLLRVIAKNAFKKELNLYAGRVAVEKAKAEGGAVAVFGQDWGEELPLRQWEGYDPYLVDWTLALLDNTGDLSEFTAIEVQTVDTTENYRTARQNLLANRSIVNDTVGLNWENVSNRIIPRIIYRGHVLQREDLCKTGLYFVCPQPVYERVLNRLGGVDRLPKFPVQPASIHFISYDYKKGVTEKDGTIQPLDIVAEHCTTVYKIQEAFSAFDLPEGNVYRDAIRRTLYG